MTVYFNSSEKSIEGNHVNHLKKEAFKEDLFQFSFDLDEVDFDITVRVSNLELAPVSFFCVSHFFVFCKSGNVFKSSKLLTDFIGKLFSHLMIQYRCNNSSGRPL